MSELEGRAVDDEQLSEKQRIQVASSSSPKTRTAVVGRAIVMLTALVLKPALEE